MAADQQSVIDKSLRSVFVGNIPYDVTEEKLKDIFNEVGPVVSFKIVYDRETGKPKGYGFCEYRDQETALSAMRNLNGYEIAGRTLRVDNACTEKSRLEMQSLMQTPNEKSSESPYGEPVDPVQAPEAISKAVCSLSPEQMFDLMQQMKLCIQNNPNEARQMLQQNPQLAYALLQALVVMRVVDPGVAVTMLQKAGGPADAMGMGPSPSGPPMYPVPKQSFPITSSEPWPMGPGPVAAVPRTGLMGQDMDLRHADPRVGRGDHDLRVMPGPPVPPAPLPVGVPPVQQAPVRPQQPIPDMDTRRDPRSAGPVAGPRDPRAAMGRPGGGPAPPPAVVPSVPPVGPTAPSLSLGPGTTDQEKAALIMQVLQLSDDQIALLPPDQRQSIMVLKEQIARSSQR